MNSDDLIALRVKLREHSQRDQIHIRKIASQSGVPVSVLIEFLADGSIGDNHAQWLFSHLHYAEKDEEELRDKVARAEPKDWVKNLEKFRVFRTELSREFRVVWRETERDMQMLDGRGQYLYLKKMEECLKDELLKRHQKFIDWERIRLPDGGSYFLWKYRINARKAKAVARGAKPERAGSGDDQPPVRFRRSSDLSRRG